MTLSEWDGLVDASAVDALRSGRLSTAAKMLFTTSKTLRTSNQDAASLQIPVPSCRRIVVTSARGGAGRTALTALLGSLLALRRDDGVAAVDADFVTGSLTARLQLTPRQSLNDLAAALSAADPTPSRLGEMLPSTEAGLWVVPGGAGGDVPTVGGVGLRLSKQGSGLAFTITDCGPDLTLGNAVDVLLNAHAIVLVTPWTPDGVRSTIRELSRIGQTDRGRALVQRIVVVLNPTTPFSEALNQRRAAELLGEFSTPVMAMVYDDHIADGAPIDLSRVSEEAVRAATKIGKIVVDVACRS